MIIVTINITDPQNIQLELITYLYLVKWIIEKRQLESFNRNIKKNDAPNITFVFTMTQKLVNHHLEHGVSYIFQIISIISQKGPFEKSSTP